jgi:tetratricopeptide (TPR) repeat protein
MTTTQVWDIDEERLVSHFCLEAEHQQVVDFCKEHGHARPEDFKERLQLASTLKQLGNTKFQEGDFNASMMAALGSLHCIDFNQGMQLTQTSEQKRQVNEAMVPILSNLSIVFLKRGDAYNSCRAADLGLDTIRRLAGGDIEDKEKLEQLRAKLLFRRGLSKGQTRDFSKALDDLREAAKLMPNDRDIRKSYENCKVAIQRERGSPDDRWRGLLTDSPNTAKFQAKTSRCRRYCSQGMREIAAALRSRDNLQVT